MPPADIDLTTIGAVRKLLQDETSIPDDTLQTMVTAASRSILNETKREFAPKADKTDRSFLSTGAFLSLSPYDLRGLPESVTLYTDREESEQVVLGKGEFRPMPISAEFGVYTWLDLPAVLSGRTVQVTIKGNWGFDEIPEDVAYWCGMTVVIWSRGDISAFSTTFVVEEGRVERPADLPSAVAKALKHYRLLGVG